LTSGFQLRRESPITIVEAFDLLGDNSGPLAEPQAWIRDDGPSWRLARERPDNRNDQPRAHSQAGESAEERGKRNQRGSVVKKPGHPQLIEIKLF
jgi:hypothetical protein